MCNKAFGCINKNMPKSKYIWPLHFSGCLHTDLLHHDDSGEHTNMTRKYIVNICMYIYCLNFNRLLKRCDKLKNKTNEKMCI